MIPMRSKVWELQHKLIKGDNLAFVHSISFTAGAYDGVVKGKACAQPGFWILLYLFWLYAWPQTGQLMWFSLSSPSYDEDSMPTP